MPLYEYACEKCGKRFEVMQKFSDEPLIVHPDCGGHVERLISAPAFHFKGSGWYVNDYAKDKKSESSNGPAKSEKAGDKSTESKSTSSDGGDKSTSSTPASTTLASSSTDNK